jgi:serine protease Do
VVGRDDASDVALLKVDAGRPLDVLPLGDSDRLRVADWVMVVGNPFGLSHTVTVGIVSQIGRSGVAPAGREGYYDFLQTDASINPGNSGGPLVNLRGEVVGIATAVNTTGQGIGFAVPINMAKQILTQLREHGRVVHSWMGVSVRELHGAAAAPPVPGHPRRELLVTSVDGGSPAYAGGLRVGDVITGFDGQSISTAARLRWYVAMAGVGRSISIRVRRGAAEHSMHVQLAELPPGPPRDTLDPVESGTASGADEEAPGTGSLRSGRR